MLKCFLMESRDDKIKESEPSPDMTERTERDFDHSESEGCAAPAQQSADERADGGADVKPIGELVSVAVKAVAVALSFVILLTCLLAVAMPLTTMRIFNSLGMSERAVDFGERYIAGELDDYDASQPDSPDGNYVVVSETPELCNDDFLEALYVCTNLSYKMMENYYAEGKTELGAYYARRVEKYTRMYLSLYDISKIEADDSAYNIAQMPSVMLRPVVYSYGHTVRTMNFRARAYLGRGDAVNVDRMMFNSRRVGNAVTTTLERSRTFGGLDLDPIGSGISWQRNWDDMTPEQRGSMMSTVDDYVDYIGCLAEYIDVECILAGVENDLGKKVVVNGELTPVLSQPYTQYMCWNALDGDEFSLFFSDSYLPGSAERDAFSPVYLNLSRFGEYAQAAVDFVPKTVEEQLHQLYWVRVFNETSRKLWYMSFLWYYSRDNFGLRSEAIRNDFGNGICVNYTFVLYEVPGSAARRQLSDVYPIMLQKYVSIYHPQTT